MENDRTKILFESLSKVDPEVQRRIQAIQDGIKRLPEIPAYEEILGGFKEGDVFKGEGPNDIHFQACLIVIGKSGHERTRVLRVDVYGEPRSRAKTVVDFMLALQRAPDARAGAHDDIDNLLQDQLYWKMP